MSLGFVLLLCVLHSNAQEDYSGIHSGQVKKTLINVSQMCGGLEKPVRCPVTEFCQKKKKKR